LSNPNSEKYGWTGDVHLFSETADYTYDLQAFWTKWLQDFPDAQQWIDADGLIPVTVPELRVKRHIVSDVTWLAVYPFLLGQMYRHCRDSSIIALHYAPLKKWLAHVLDVSEGYIANGIWGDHVIPGEDKESLGASRGMTRLLNTAYLYNIAGMLAEFAAMTGSPEDASHFQELASGVYETFNSEFYQEEKGLYMESPSPEGFYYELTANLVPLQMDIVPDERKEKILGFVMDHIKSRDYRSYTGILGTKALVDVLQEAGEQEFLYQIIRNTIYPGWGYTMEELGGSTLNQTWNGRGDFNHCMFGSIDEFYYNDLLGIKFDFSGTDNIIFIAPYQPEDLIFAKGRANSVYGEVASGWEKTTEGMTYSLDIPHNTLGVFTAPAFAGAYEMIINGEQIIREGRLVNQVDWIKDIQPGENNLTIRLGSGNYEIMINEI
jgi:alpha-L-rhamnosidase